MEHEDHKEHQDRKELQPISSDTELIGRHVIDAAMKVHQVLGPGLLESTYEHCLAHELGARNVPFRRQVALPVHYEGLRLDAGYRLDMVVAEVVVVEIKSVEALSRLHEGQVLTYLRLSGFRLGFLMNFNALQLKQGLRRFVH